MHVASKCEYSSKQRDVAMPMHHSATTKVSHLSSLASNIATKKKNRIYLIVYDDSSY